MVKHMYVPGSNARMKTLTRTFNGGGYGTVLLDGGLGGQSSYFGIDNYMDTVRHPPTPPPSKSGKGLADRLSSRLSRLSIAPPTKQPHRKNITLSI